MADKLAGKARCDRHGRLEMVLNNVGITSSGGPVEFDEAQWDRTMDVNAKSVFLTAKTVLPRMERQGSGSIVNIA